ncbi:MAG: NYN domain-containing protein [Chitinophagales bacterium]|nr:NYN domain-containing protein [Chitinophagales bacterium]MDW8419052.1 NYN domain-containing protein [Chitinophagales bacterium]
MNVNSKDTSLTKIGVFYDGNYFIHVSNYYAYQHERKSRISIGGLHDFIRYQVAEFEGTEERLCQIVDAHYFRGRLSATEALNKGNTLYYDRVFDDILSSEGVTTHYLPIRTKPTGERQEKGIDVWLALEAFELAFYKRFNVLVLIASDGDYVPLIRKLNSLGTRVMVLSWDFEYTDENGNTRGTRTSQELLEEVTYPVSMHEIIENRIKKNEPIINNLFVQKSAPGTFVKRTTGFANEKPLTTSRASGAPKKESYVKAIKNGYGFIHGDVRDVFFYHSDLMEYDFNELRVGDKVLYIEEELSDGRKIAKEIEIIQSNYQPAY